MNEDFATRAWAENEGSFVRDIIALVRSVRLASERIVACAYDAPWERDTGTCRG